MSNVEWDLLADYVGGALDGPDAAYVAHLVRTDAAWAQAYQELLAADRLVAGELAQLGFATERMPVDVAARLDEVLASARQEAVIRHTMAHHVTEPSVAAAVRSDAAAEPSVIEPSSAASGSTAALPRARQGPARANGVRQGPPPRADGRVTSPARARRRRWMRAGGVVVTAAAALVLGVVGLPMLREAGILPAPTVRQDSAAVSGSDFHASRQPSGEPAGGGVQKMDEPVVTAASGRDYQRSTLMLAATPNRAGITDSAPPGGVPAPSELTVAAQLIRLTGPAEFKTCLDAVTARYGGRVVFVDFARFEGVPALIIRITAPDQVVVVGPSCGLAGMDTDTRYHVKAN